MRILIEPKLIKYLAHEDKKTLHKIQNFSIWISKILDRVRKVKYPAYGYDNALNGNRVDQITKLGV